MPPDTPNSSSGGTGDENNEPERTKASREAGGGATLAPQTGDPFDPDDSGPWVAHGVAIPSDAVTYGKSETRTFWPADVIHEGADKLADAHLIKNHPKNPGIEDIIGQVTDHRFIDGLGLAWEGEIDDRKTAKQVQRGRVQASPYLFRMLGEHIDQHNARVAKRILHIRDLGIVPEGAGDQFGADTSVESGPHPDMAMTPATGETAEALAAAFPGPDDHEHEQQHHEHDTTGDDPHSRETHSQEASNADTGDSTTMSNESTDNGTEQLRKRISDLEDENERLEAENEQAREVFAEALEAAYPDDSPLDADTLADKFTLDELRTHADAQGDGTLTVEPVSGGTPSAQNPGPGPSHQGDVGAEALAAAEQDKLEALETRADLFRGRDGMDQYVEQVENEMNALTGNGGDA